MRVVALLFFLPSLVFSQSDISDRRPESFTHYLSLYSSTDQGKVQSTSSDELVKWVQKLDAKRSGFSNDKDFLRYLFTKTQNRILKNFVEYSSFSDLLAKGQYNCLTATALYALLLDRFDIDYEIVETNYHIFVITNVNGERVLLETTDPVNGFVDQPDAIADRINTYKKSGVAESSKSKTYYAFDFDLYDTVNLNQMMGLLYYNQAVKAYNSHQLGLSITLLNSASDLYQSPRTEAFSRIVLLSVAESSLDRDVKVSYISQLQTIRKKKANTLASASLN